MGYLKVLSKLESVKNKQSEFKKKANSKGFAFFVSMNLVMDVWMTAGQLHRRRVQ
jgi:hypothetical protein